MSSARLRMIVAILGASAPTALSAQVAGRITPYNPVGAYDPAGVEAGIKMKPEDQARTVMNAYAACLLQYNPRGVTSFLGVLPGDPDYVKAAGRVITDECLSSGKLTFPTGLLRGAIYKASYEKYYASKNLSLAPAISSISREGHAVDAPTNIEYFLLLDFADCVVHKDLEHSRALVLAAPGSAAESAALTQLMPNLGPCMPQGAKVTFNKIALVGVVAEALVRGAASPDDNGARGQAMGGDHP